MAVIKFKPGRRLGLYATPTLRNKAVAGTNFFIGSVLTSVTAHGGFLIEAGANPLKIIGIADERGGNKSDSSQYVRVVPAFPHVLFEGTVRGGAATQVALDETFMWQDFGVTKDPTEAWYVDVSKQGATSRARIVEFLDDTGTIDGRVEFVFLGQYSGLNETV